MLRNFYNAEALKMFSWTGVGIGNFTDKLREIIPTMDEYIYQPVHNIYLLIYTETGLFGLSSFLIFLIFIMRDFVIRTEVKRFHHYSLIFQDFFNAHEELAELGYIFRMV